MASFQIVTRDASPKGYGQIDFITVRLVVRDCTARSISPIFSFRRVRWRLAGLAMSARYNGLAIPPRALCK
jgi:hypothetical protein